MASDAQLTPMMAQYRRIKGELPKDALLLFPARRFLRVMFFEDAKDGSQLLNLSLTARNGVPMCGLPHHAANGYIARILKRRAQGRYLRSNGGSQTRPSSSARGHANPFARHGILTERMLVAERQQLPASVYPSGKIFGLALVD